MSARRFLVGRGGQVTVRKVVALAMPMLLVVQLLPQMAQVVRAADEVSVSLNNGTVLSDYVGFNLDATDPNPQNLTTAGATDWRIWGSGSASFAGDDRKAGGSGINPLSDIESGPAIPHRALGGLGLGIGIGPSTMPFSFSWADGSTTASGSNVKAGLQHDAPSAGSVGYGFRLTASGSTTPQRLKLWVSAHHGTGKLTATMGNTVVDTGVSGGQNNGGVYTIDFTGDGSPEEFLEVSWVLDSVSSGTDEYGYNSTEANVVIYAAALSGAPEATIEPPTLYQAGETGEGQAAILGRLAGNPGSTYEITVKTAATCVDGALGSGAATLGSFEASTGGDGNANFAGLVPLGTGLASYVSAEVSDGPGGVTSLPSSCIVAGETNDTWTRAREITLVEGAGSATGHIDDIGRARWYKVAIQPGQRLEWNLTDLPADFDMFAFRDINQAFVDLVTDEDLTRLTAEFAPSAFSPSAFSPSAFSPSAFSPSAFSPSAFSPSAFSPSAFSPSAFSPSAFSP
ncbi:MAG: hypothetical protein ACSLFN_10245 [Candidatus Limnocylindrales bacterium]